MVALKPPLPGETAAAYHRRVTAADGVPVHEPVVVYQEHHFWVLIGNVIKRWQVMIGLFGIVVVVAGLTLKINALITSVEKASVKLDRVDQMVTKEQLASDLVQLADSVTSRVNDGLQFRTVSWITDRKDIIVSCPVYTVRGLSNKACQIERLKLREQ